MMLRIRPALGGAFTARTTVAFTASMTAFSRNPRISGRRCAIRALGHRAITTLACATATAAIAATTSAAARSITSLHAASRR